MDERTVGIIGAGTMGAGIAQVAIVHGWNARLFDAAPGAANEAIHAIGKRLDRLVEKRRMSQDERRDAAARLTRAAAVSDLAPCGLVIEAIVEDLEIKTGVLRTVLETIDAGAIVATNTSSLSVSALGEACGAPARLVGMHFFNPAPLLALVEVVAGRSTDPAVVERTIAIAESWDKKVARAADVPGFIVNHVARPYYLEAFRVLEDGLADPALIDRAMCRLGGFRMGPLTLTDLIGQDVNTATTRSVWEQLDRPPLLRPSPLQERLAAEGRLGRKTGRGVYRYDAEPPASDVDVETGDPPSDPDLHDAVARFVTGATDVPTANPIEALIFARVLVALIAQAAHAHERGVASPADIDTALRFGTNYPRGPFAWAESIGHDVCAELLDALNETVDDNRFAVPDGLRANAGSP